MMFKKEKLNKMLRIELNQIILKEFDFSFDRVITITRVEVSENGFNAKVFVSVIPLENKEEVLKALKRKVFFVQQKLNHRLRIRPVPKIEFMEEGKTEQAGRVEELLKKVKDMEKN
ncbi:MAG: 30S ribosome-binding factor RbfA [Candidatus Pacebacteria bacterium]|nr:30S ribosome-binding factor RbfA [Candidatus Paceibacterota bacterium]MDD3510219.1 30S ribosome-binding factor RbfA [Candidatus Paceibacterota bacterium]